MSERQYDGEDVDRYYEASAFRALLKERDTAIEERNKLRAALAALVGASSREELEQVEIGLRMMPAPAEDKAVSINAVHALLATLP